MSYKTKLKLMELGTMFTMAMLTGGVVFVVCRLSH